MSSNKLIPLCIPNLSGNEKKYLTNCINTNYVSSIGKYVSSFELKVKNYLKSKYAISCNSGTSALHLALRVIGVNKNHEVIIPTVSFIATANSIKYLNADPIFMDCDEYFNIDVKKTISFLNEKTYFRNNNCYNKKTGKIIKAIIVVHVFGNAADLNSLINTCKKKNIKLVEDAAAAFGTKYKSGKLKNKFAGTIGDIGCISFNGNKVITCGGGGMILTNNKKYFNLSKYLSTQAYDSKFDYTHNDIGYNYRLANVNAAIGLAQIEKINYYLKRKEKNFNFYKKNLNQNKNFSICTKPSYAKNNNYITSIFLKKKNISKKTVINFLVRNNIEARSLWKPLHIQKSYKKYEKYKIIKAGQIFKNTINIPSSTNLTKTDLFKVVLKINQLLK